MLALRQSNALSYSYRCRSMQVDAGRDSLRSISQFLVLCMLEETKQPRRLFSVALLSYIVICSFLFTSCGVSSEKDTPLTTANAPSSQQSATASTGSIGTPTASIKVIDAQTSLSSYPGGYMTLTISTSPAAICTITVYYGLQTPSSSFGIVPRTADSNGIADWHWQVAPSAHTGIWPVTISSVLVNGTKISTQVNVTVTLPPINVMASQSVLAAYPKGNATLTIATAPSVTCTLLLSDVPGQSRLLTRRANSSGIVSWTWKVLALAPAGVRPLIVTATLADGESSSIQTSFTVL